MGLCLEVQTCSAELRFHVGTSAFYDSSQQVSALYAEARALSLADPRPLPGLWLELSSRSPPVVFISLPVPWQTGLPVRTRIYLNAYMIYGFLLFEIPVTWDSSQCRGHEK
jgi:hypothetical protein